MVPAPSSSSSDKDEWHEDEQKIQVNEADGYSFGLKLLARVGGRPDLVYDILTDPRSIGIFRSLKACMYRKVLQDDGKGHRTLEVGHRAIARFLFISFTFETQLKVWEDDNKRTIKFQNLREGFMKRFDGSWSVDPLVHCTLDEAIADHNSRASSSRPSGHHKHHGHHDHHHKHHKHHHGHHGHHHHHDHHGHHHHHGLNPLSLISGIQNKLLHHHDEHRVRESFVTLEQCILPKTALPIGVKSVVRGLCAAQVRNMMEDLRSEVERRMAAEEGRPVGPMGYFRHGKKLAAPPQCANLLQAVPAACMSLAVARPLIRWDDIWEHTAPINFVIQL